MGRISGFNPLTAADWRGGVNTDEKGVNTDGKGVNTDRKKHG
jgi:hypothetical protein